MNSDIELWNSRRKKVVAETDLDPADFERLLLEYRDAYRTSDEAGPVDLAVTQDKKDKIPHQSRQAKPAVMVNNPSEACAVEFSHTFATGELNTRFVSGIFWDGSDSASAEHLFKALPRSNRIVYLVEQAVSSRYLAFEVEEIRRYTKIPVIEAIDGLAVLPGRIYLSPFMHQLALQNGHIKLQPLSASLTLAEKSLGFFSSIARHEATSPVAILFGNTHLLGGSDVLESLAGKPLSISPSLKAQNKDLLYAESVNSVIAAGGHVFFHDNSLLQSKTLFTNESGHAAALKAPAVEISVGLQRLLLGEQLDDESAQALAAVQDKVATGFDVDIEHTAGMETATSGEVFELEEAAEIDHQSALRRENDNLQALNRRLQEENAELIAICQAMDMKADAAQLTPASKFKRLDVASIALLILDKHLHLRSFNRAASESVLDIDVMDIGRPLDDLLLLSKHIPLDQVQLLESVIRKSLNLGRSGHGEPLTTELFLDGENYLISVLPFQSHGGQPVGVALSWENP